ncbi:MAG: NADH-quinone oxidoreductase subunit NuoN [Propionibacteriaceae bacterium]|jgi:NADH-quinone oxidoreductase subunit N|nr:NADH-quinone oxidoreductase subunit NuoN [Propionibacteriaceae bacterium]
METMNAPTIEWLQLSPLLIVLAGAVLGVLVEGIAPKAYRYFGQLCVLALTFACSLTMLIYNWFMGNAGVFAMGALALDGPSYIAWAFLLVFGALSLMLFAERRVGHGASVFAAAAATVPGSRAEALAEVQGREHTEVFTLGLFSLSGMMVFCAANDLITMFIALEVMSLPLYLLSAMARRRRMLSQEAALKYFLLGAFASAFFLFGIALMYGMTNTLSFTDMAQIIAASTSTWPILAAVGLMAVGLLFKIGAVPFQSWVPDVYTGAPTPVTGFMAIGVKMAAVLGLTRVFLVPLGGLRWNWQVLLAIVAILTMAVGAVMALTQTNIKRLLAYSAISHAGFILTAIVGAQAGIAEGQGPAFSTAGSVLFYLIAYGFATITAFAIVTLVRNNAGEAWEISEWQGLGKKNPVVAVFFAIALLSFAGIPLTAGFIGKWAVFSAAWAGGYAWLAIVGIGFSLLAAYLYLKVIIAMFFKDPAPSVEVASASPATWIPIGVGTIASVGLGLVPGPLLELISNFSVFLR